MHIRTVLGISCLIVCTHFETKSMEQKGKDKEKEKPIMVRVDTQEDHPYLEICPEERAYLEKRMPIAKDALEKALKCSLDGKYIPKIAILGSGGGYRAACFTTGSLDGIRKINLFNALTHMIGLSGSTWAISSYVTNAKESKDFKKLKEFKKALSHHMARPFHETTDEEKEEIKKSFADQKEHHQQFNLGSAYGALLAKTFLADQGDQKQRVTLSQQANRIRKAKRPLPVYAAIDSRNSVSENPPHYAVTPFEVMNLTHKTAIPTRVCGSLFYDGVITEPNSENNEPPLARFMAGFGSAFSANLENVETAIESSSETMKHIHKLWAECAPHMAHQPHIPLLEKFKHTIEDTRLLPFWIDLPNYAYNMEGQENAHEKRLKLADGGLAENIPFAQAMQCEGRQPDIMIIFDASAGIMGEELKKMGQYARDHNIPCPPIDYTQVGQKTMSIFKDPSNPKAPVIIYMPRISDPELWKKHKAHAMCSQFNLDNLDLEHETNNGWAKTEHFCYTPDHSTQVINQATFNVWANRKEIFKTIQEVIEERSK